MALAIIRSEPETDPNVVVRRSPGSCIVRDLSPPLLRERLTRYARWLKRVRGADGEIEERPAHPPVWCVNAIHARGVWPKIRHLEAVVNHPVVLPDGSMLATNGYDPRSRLLVSIPADLQLAVPDHPTRKDVAAAVATIDDVLSDFPFEKPEHRAAWFAGLLTPLAWFAFEGPAPLLLIDGNVRGVGKGLLADVLALILTGRRFPVMSYTADKEELRKKITSLAIEGERLVLLDNLAGAVGNDVLDMALTADRWKDRVLGANRVYDGPLNVCWYATGNNIQLHADTARRCSHCRLETGEERPELRADVKYPNLRQHVREQRGRLLSAALTILRGWYVAGKPRHGLTPWGSFEGWSGVVREAVVFAGLPDPGETRLALQTTADRDALAMSALIDALARMDPDRRGVTTAEIIEPIRKPADPIPEWHADLKSLRSRGTLRQTRRSNARISTPPLPAPQFQRADDRQGSGREFDQLGSLGGRGGHEFCQAETITSITRITRIPNPHRLVMLVILVDDSALASCSTAADPFELLETRGYRQR